MSARSTDAEALEATEAWFRRQGMPHLIEDYSTRRDILTRTLPASHNRVGAADPL